MDECLTEQEAIRKIQQTKMWELTQLRAMLATNFAMMGQREMVMDAQLIARLLRLDMNAQGGGSLAS